MLAIGVMSGTSCDGVDAVLVDLADPDVRHVPKLLAHAFVPYPEALVRELTDPLALTLPRVAELSGYVLPRLYADCVRRLDGHARAEVVGCHGQTVWHAPPSRATGAPCTLQLGSASALAELLSLPVVGNLRAANLVAGGEGAPIAPLAHFLFTPPEHTGRLVVNVGGIANVTYVGATMDDVRAADIGPGMMIVDALARRSSGGALDCDRDGALSAKGATHAPLVDHVLAHAFFARPAPRTTGREDFGAAYVDALVARFAALTGPELVRSAVAATAECIARAARAPETRATEISSPAAARRTRRSSPRCVPARPRRR